KIIGISIALAEGVSAYIPMGHDYPDMPKQLDADEVLSCIKPHLENPKKIKLGHNLKYIMSVFTNNHIHLKGPTFDTMLESYTINSSASRHDLVSLAFKYLEAQISQYMDLIGQGKNKLSFHQVEIEKAAFYAAE